MKKIKVYRIAEDKEFTGVIEIRKDLDSYYKAMDCELIDVVQVKLGSRKYDIIVDDEGMLKPDFVITAVDPTLERYLAGNILIAKYTGNGNFGSISETDIKNIENNLLKRIVDDNRIAPVILGFQSA
jgi:hypothetical protein